MKLQCSLNTCSTAADVLLDFNFVGTRMTCTVRAGVCLSYLLQYLGKFGMYRNHSLNTSLDGTKL